MSRLSLALSLGLILVLALAGCKSDQPDSQTLSTPGSAEGSPAATAAQTEAPAGPTPSSAPASSLTPSPDGPILPPVPITLTVWTPEEFAPGDEDAGQRLLLNQLLVYDRGQPEVAVEVLVKRPTGPGSIMDYLETARLVAPSILPDVVVMNSQMLAQAAASQALQPLDELIAPDLVDGVFPVARALGRVDGTLVGIPFRLDWEHLVYNAIVLTDSVPSTWQAILASGGPYLFPAGEEARVDSVLIHYLAAGGTLANEGGAARFEIDPLTEVFRFYQQARVDDVLSRVILQTDSLAESWETYLQGQTLIAHTTTALYLAERANLPTTGFAPLPGPEQAGPPLLSGWYWAILTPDPARQQVAAGLIDWLMAPDNLGVWSYASQWLPALESAFSAWPGDDPYLQFAREQILAALPQPGEAYYLTVQTRLRNAARDVLLGVTSPAAAADSVR